MLPDKLLHALGSLLDRPPCVIWKLTEPGLTCDDAHQIGNPELELGVSKHHADEGLPEWLKGGLVGVWKMELCHRETCAHATDLPGTGFISLTRRWD